jgi:hypothetical protein
MNEKGRPQAPIPDSHSPGGTVAKTRDGAGPASNLSRGKGRTKRPRVYAGCLPCGQARYVADIEHANIWLETHWKRCKRSTGLGGVSLVQAATAPSERAGKEQPQSRERAA